MYETFIPRQRADLGQKALAVIVEPLVGRNWALGLGGSTAARARYRLNGSDC